MESGLPVSGLQTSSYLPASSRLYETLVARCNGEDTDLVDRVFSFLDFTRLGGVFYF